MKSTKFVTACYILSFVAYHGPDMIATQTIARWVNTNASRVRQLVARLVRAGLLNSTRGGEGGVALARAPSSITLLDIFEAVAEPSMALFSVDNPFSDWQDRCRVHSVLSTMRGELDRDFRGKLVAIRLSSLFAEPRRQTVEDLQTKKMTPAKKNTPLAAPPASTTKRKIALKRVATAVNRGNAHE